MISTLKNFRKLLSATLAVAFIVSAMSFSVGQAKASEEGKALVLGLGAIIMDKMIEAEENKNGGSEEEYESDRDGKYPDENGGQDEEYNEDEQGNDQY